MNSGWSGSNPGPFGFIAGLLGALGRVFDLPRGQPRLEPTLSSSHSTAPPGFDDSDDDDVVGCIDPFTRNAETIDAWPSTNPATGLPMSGMFDVAGNAYGFSDDMFGSDSFSDDIFGSSGCGSFDWD